ncbi:hypothetical protein ABIB25_001861 [Nakamurella sp. UYEF19]|uniref:hypothetical protein n=1 Tax=Nakamurella sp. UYEF19 TaxID=1756392 RepID=UPI0033966640
MSEAPSPAADRSDEPPPTGPRRILIALYLIFALAATARGIVQVATTFHTAPLAYVLSLFSGVVYIGAAVGLTSERPWSRRLAWGACGTELVGVLVVGTASLIDRAAFPHDTVWSRFGSGYGYFPLLLPILGLMWLWYSRPDADT